MNTKWIMSASAIVMGIVGIICSFFPKELSSFFHLNVEVAESQLLIQIIGALYFGFAMLNWTARANVIGGIYGRPVCIGNLSHFLVGALALLKLYFAQQIPVLPIVILYVVFAVLFAIVFRTTPKSSSNS